jgi:hypothetical protein
MRLDFCVACGHKGDDINHHHLMPKSYGGSDNATNLITLCRECHGLLHGKQWSNDYKKLQHDGYARARSRGIHIGRPFKLNANQQAEAISRYEHGETQMEISKAYGVHNATISRLCNRACSSPDGRATRLT